MIVCCYLYLSVLFVVSSAEICDNSSIYRTYDGSCNNLKHPKWGRALTTYGRLLPPNYGDGVSSLTNSRSGQSLPNARLISYKLFPDYFVLDDAFTLATMQYGQIITHDMSLNLLDGTPFKCCTETKQFLDSSETPRYCLPIHIPYDDPDYSKENQTCMAFLRTITTRDLMQGVSQQPAEQISQVNHFLDLSIVYGNSKALNSQLRQFKNGLLKVEYKDDQEWPIRSNNITDDCVLSDPKEACFFASDPRINQNTHLTLIQIVLLREHNRIARELFRLNPRWNDEILFQEARKINIAQHQFISYYELLPILLGEEYLEKAKVLYKGRDVVKDYDENIDPSVLNEHAHAAFRHFHSMIADKLLLASPLRDSKGNIRLSDWYFRPHVLEEKDNFDCLARGLTTQKAWGSDRYYVKEVTNYLFRGGAKLGLDLRALDIHRGRDHGLPSYNQMRQFCGMSRANTFDELKANISEKVVEKLKAIYHHPDDIDLVVGGALENNLRSALLGPTYHCIMLKQFKKTRVADRFWFENTGFTTKQIQELKKSSISRLLCDNGKNIKFMQVRGFVRISDSNPLEPCEGLPRTNLSLWKY